ncbi:MULTISPECIES: redoxin domain-containing protein [unclassified Imperialibacter]|uniref:TlpA family protein disulfide reductase n=1 Tax=unclassified Imperialibacter TaxID=2629706 RepID=UPI001258134A|nr:MULTISPECIES: redoxin domain-containing protein [unclassified Imperialibacter]CAD5255224.1 putative AhpC/TSA family protein [Imperialibacter sp. 75]CAD5263788.1 putative AhpC/TSA family protein [Imperialibacter sp. 89]VVT35505.1 putative AhpC/TSA family protein [Imperialibacter sp. EC-SDR9]
MKRKLFILFYALLAIGAIAWLATKSMQMLAAKEERQKHVQSLPAFKFMSVDEHQLALSALAGESALVLVAFNSACDHCQYEAKSISGIIDSYPDTQFIFLSEEPLDTIRHFQSTYFPVASSNITFGQTSIVDLHETFGSLSYPNIFIYGKDGKLLKEFKGETKPEAIEVYLK